jgi:hypothetical protein
VTLAIAIYGAVLATVGIAVQLYVIRRDRPDLVVAHDVTITRGGPYVLRVGVTNRGKRATTLIDVGLEVSGGLWQANINETGERRIIPVIRLSDEGSVRLLQPGDITYYERTQTVALYPIDSPLRPYAVDSHGRMTWGRAHPFLRWFFDAGWQPANSGTEVTEPSDRPLYVAPVAPVWQVWKSRPLRGSWRRSKDYGLQRWRRRAMRVTFTPKDSPTADEE